MNMGERIKQLRKQNNMTMEELGKLIGVQRQAIQKYENGTVTNIPRSAIEIMAKRFGVSPSYLLCFEEDVKYCDGMEITDAVRIPVLKNTAEGTSAQVAQQIIGYEEISREIALSGRYFAMKVEDRSMQPRICEDDMLIVREQKDAESGDIVIAVVNGCEVICRKLFRYEKGMILMPLNTSYQPMMFSNQEISEKVVQIIGKVIENRQRF